MQNFYDKLVVSEAVLCSVLKACLQYRILCSQRNVLSQGQNLKIISDMEVQCMVKSNFTFNHTMVTVFWPIGTFLCKHKIW